MASDPYRVAHRIVDGVALTEYFAGRPRQSSPIVFVHGGCHGAWTWAGMQRWLAEHGWNSLAFDWYAHGDSRAIPTQDWVCRGIPQVAEEIGIACAAAGGRPVLVGHSMGGLASLAYAAGNPESLAALVLLTPVVPRPYADAAIDIAFDPETPWGPPPPDIARQLFYSGVDDALAAEYYARLQSESPQAVFEATRWTVDVEVGNIQVPVLAVAAEHDLLVPAAYVQALGADIGATVVTLAGVGHGVQHDPEWPQLAERLDAWLTETLLTQPLTARDTSRAARASLSADDGGVSIGSSATARLRGVPESG